MEGPVPDLPVDDSPAERGTSIVRRPNLEMGAGAGGGGRPNLEMGAGAGGGGRPNPEMGAGAGVWAPVGTSRRGGAARLVRVGR
ncbi:hypothetical protein GCM10023225_07000 [Kineococcus glutinatus]|uniref:Uncharacterized protein n=1 Tax=Kineococcus glutinatus TaxID=1070872 RepID=A0ABP9HBY2_9ACTN